MGRDRSGSHGLVLRESAGSGLALDRSFVGIPACWLGIESVAMDLEFEWDPEKASANLNKHGVDFQEAKLVFNDPLARVIADLRHSEQEPRFVILGHASSDHLFVVVFTDRDEKIRIMSARHATPAERRRYETFQPGGA